MNQIFENTAVTLILMGVTIIIPMMCVCCFYHVLKRSKRARRIREINARQSYRPPSLNTICDESEDSLLAQHFIYRRFYFPPITSLIINEDRTDHDCLPSYEEATTTGKHRYLQVTAEKCIVVSNPPSYDEVVVTDKSNSV